MNNKQNQPCGEYLCMLNKEDCSKKIQQKETQLFVLHNAK